MEYPYADIFYLLQITGLQENPKNLSHDGSMLYADLTTALERAEHYRTDGNVFYLWSDTHHSFTPFYPHMCWDHLIFLAKNFNIQGNALANEGLKTRSIQKECIGLMLVTFSHAIAECLCEMNLPPAWKKMVESLQVITQSVEDAERIDGTKIIFRQKL